MALFMVIALAALSMTIYSSLPNSGFEGISLFWSNLLWLMVGAIGGFLFGGNMRKEPANG